MLLENFSKFLVNCFDIVEMLFGLSLLLGFDFAVKLEIDIVWSKIVLSDGFVIFQQRNILAIWLFHSLPLIFFPHINFLGMQQLLQILIFNFGELILLSSIFREFGFGKPFLPLFGGFGNIVNNAIIIAIDLLFEKFSDSALSMLISPKIAELFKIGLLHVWVTYIKNVNFNLG